MGKLTAFSTELAVVLRMYKWFNFESIFSLSASKKATNVLRHEHSLSCDCGMLECWKFFETVSAVSQTRS